MSTVRLTLDSPHDGDGYCSACQRSMRWKDVSMLLYRPLIQEWDSVCIDCSVMMLQSSLQHFRQVEVAE